MVVQHFVELCPCLHAVDHILLRSFFSECAVYILRRFAHRPECRQWVKCETHPRITQLFRCEQRCFSKFGDICQHRHIDCRSKLLVFPDGGQRLGKNHVGTCFHVGSTPLERRRLSFHRVGICPRHDHESFVRPGIYGGLDPVAHFTRAHQRLARSMTASLCLHLVFDMYARRPGSGQIPDCASDHERLAPACVCIHQQRQIGCTGDAPDILAYVIETRDTEIREAKGCIGHAGP